MKLFGHAGFGESDVANCQNEGGAWLGNTDGTGRCVYPGDPLYPGIDTSAPKTSSVLQTVLIVAAIGLAFYAGSRR